MNIALRKSENRQTTLHWQEQCQHPGRAVAKKTGASFGSTLIARCVATLRAEITRDVTDDGFKMTLTLPGTDAVG